MLLKSREEELKSIIRYTQNPVCKPMFYTPNLWIHIQRVTWLAQELCKQLWYNNELSQKIIRRAMFHDDSEIIAGDIATPVKMNWSQKQIDAYALQCKNAIPILVKAYGKEIGDDYEKILSEEEKNKKGSITKEQEFIHIFIEYVDKLDALMEVLHELSSWSSWFLSNMKKVFWKDITCWEYIISRVQSRYDSLQSFLNDEKNTGLLNLNQIINLNINKISQSWVSHSKHSVQDNTWIEVYDIWKKLHFSHGTQEHQKYLYIQNITR